MKTKNLIVVAFFVLILISASFGCQSSQKTLKVTFYVDGKVYFESEYQSNSISNLPPVPTKNGYTFNKWCYVINGAYIDVDFNKLETFANQNRIELHANFDVKIDLNASVLVTLYNSAKEDYFTTNHKYGLVYTPPKLNDTETHFFVGWYQDIGYLEEYIPIAITNDLELYAKFKLMPTHNYGEWEIIKNATCNSDGEKLKKCLDSDCGYILNSIIPKLTHIYIITTEKPTCTTQGYKKFKCYMCLDEYHEEIVVPIGHNFSEFVITKAATCLEKGIKERHCQNTNCIEKEEVELEIFQHSYVKTTVLPTCISVGYDNFNCSVCNDCYTENNVSILGHSFTNYSTEVAPSCELEGESISSCERENCKETNTTVIPKLTHNYIEEVVLPTCSQNGFSKFTCSNCNHSYKGNVTELIPHSLIESIVLPTCILGGFNLFTCSFCDYSYKNNPTPTIEHNLSSWEETSSNKERHCLNYNCDYKEVVTLPKVELLYKLNDDQISYSVIGLTDKSVRTLEILTMYNNLPVTVIGEEAFIDMPNLMYLYIGEGVNKILANAFSNCLNLGIAHIPKSIKNDKTAIDKTAFTNCSNVLFLYSASTALETVPAWLTEEFIGIVNNGGYTTKLYSKISDANYLYKDGFHYYFDGKSVNLLKYTGNAQNIELPNIITIKKPYPVVTINEYAFSKNNFVKTVNINSDLTLINVGAFINCKNLQKIFIPQSVTSIYKFAFKDNYTNFAIYTKHLEKPKGWQANYKEAATAVYFNCDNFDVIKL